MPTGYTSKLNKGKQSFEEFVWECARNMGACIPMRDEPFDVLPPKHGFEPATNYHEEELKKLYEYNQKLASMGPEECNKQAEKQYKNDIKHRNKRIAETIETLDRYREMLDRITNWEAPTSNHTEFKNFMVSQLKQSIQFDDDVEYYKDLKIKKLSGTAWKSEEKDKTAKKIRHHEEEIMREQDRTTERNEWLKQLRESVPYPEGR